MTIIAIPDPSPTLDHRSICRAIMEWAPTTENVDSLRDTDAKLAAIETYMGQTSREGLAEVGRARLAVTIRIGELTPKEKPGPTEFPRAPGKLSGGLSSQRAADFRKLAANKDIVTDYGRKATDQRPPTVYGALKAIEVARFNQELDWQDDWIAELTPDDYDPTEDARRAAIWSAIRTVHDAVQTLAAYSPSDINWALSTGLDHVRQMACDRLRDAMQNLLILTTKEQAQ